MAQSWADGCFFAHGGTSSGGQFGWIGQNLWAGSGTSWDVYGMVESWYNEVQDYNYNNGNCNGVCGHYTQVCWTLITSLRQSSEIFKINQQQNGANSDLHFAEFRLFSNTNRTNLQTLSSVVQSYSKINSRIVNI